GGRAHGGDVVGGGDRLLRLGGVDHLGGVVLLATTATGRLHVGDADVSGGSVGGDEQRPGHAGGLITHTTGQAVALAETRGERILLDVSGSVGGGGDGCRNGVEHYSVL